MDDTKPRSPPDQSPGVEPGGPSRAVPDADGSTSPALPTPSRTRPRSNGSNGARPDPDPSADELEQLRNLIVGPDREWLAGQARRWEDPRRRAKDVADVLPRAVWSRPAPDAELGAALAPHFEEAFRESVRKDPRQIADAISPILGPAIRKSIADALQRMVQSLNATVQHGFTPRGLKWRLEAWRTGKSFGEVVLLHSLRFRVEQVFLIHREAGLLLQHVSAPEAALKDADMISAMLTAIRDFMRDSFDAAGEDAPDSFRMTDLSVWVAQGPTAVVAAVIRGTAPESLRTRLYEANERIHEEFRDALAAFKQTGDTAAFNAARPTLEACLEQALLDEPPKEAAAPPRRPSRLASGTIRAARVAWKLAALAVVVLSVWGFFDWRHKRLLRRLETAQWDALVARFRAEPGYVVTAAERTPAGGYYVDGLRDPMARHPGEVFAEAAEAGLQASLDAGLPQENFVVLSPADAGSGTAAAPRRVAARWTDWHSSHESFAGRRAAVALGPPPPGVTIELKDRVLRATGAAPAEWIDRASRTAPLIAGVDRFDGSGLARTATEPTPAERDAALLAAARAALVPPPMVTLSARDGVLSASGSAARDWVRWARGAAPKVPGVRAYDDAQLVESGRQRVDVLARAIEAPTFQFRPGTAQLDDRQEQQLAAVAQACLDLIVSAREAGVLPTVVIVGDATGEEAPQDWVLLGRGRADVVKAALVDRGVPPAWLKAVGSSMLDAAAAAGPTTGPTVAVPVTLPAGAKRPRVAGGSVAFTVLLAPTPDLGQ